MVYGRDIAPSDPSEATPSALDQYEAPGRPSAVLANTVGLVGVATIFGVAIAAMLFLQPTVRAAGAQSQVGAELFQQHCASCHQATGLGIEGTFPPLVGNPAAADAAYVEDVIRDGLSGPIEVLGVPYDADMPPAVALTDPGEIADVVQYVVALADRDAPGPAADGTADPAADGTADSVSETDGDASGPIVADPARGHDLFIGADRFENGGAACVACHTAGQVGNLGGQSLGPDLTDAFDSLGGEAGLDAWLINPPSPTMQPIFADRQLSDGERADLAAFLGDASRQGRADSDFDRLSAAGVLGLVGLIAGMALAWRGMRQTYVEHLRSNGRNRRPRSQGVGTRKPMSMQSRGGSVRSLPGTRPAQAERSSR